MGSVIETISVNPAPALSSISFLGDFIFKGRGEAEGIAEGQAVGMAGEAGLESGLAGRAGGDLDGFSLRDAGLAWGDLVVACFNLKIIDYQTFANIYCLN